MLKAAGGFHTPLQQLFLLEERVRLAGAALPEELGGCERFHGIKCVIKGVNCLVDIRKVAEVIEDKAVTPVPGCVAWIEGVMNYRGALVPVYNLQGYLRAADDTGEGSGLGSGPLVVLKNRHELCAVRVDSVTGMQKFSDDEFRRPVSGGATPRNVEHYIDASSGGDGQVWHRLDTDRLLDTITRENPRQQ